MSIKEAYEKGMISANDYNEIMNLLRFKIALIKAKRAQDVKSGK